MIPRTYPSQVNSTTGRVEMKVSFINDPSGLTRWIDYIPVSYVTDSTPKEGSYDNDGYIAVVDVGSTSGLQAGKDYVRVVLEQGSTDAWQVSSVGFIPVGYSGFGSIPTLFANSEPGVWYDPSDMSTLFQDSAGTTPVTAVEQPVGLMLDKSRNGIGANGAFRYNLLTKTEQFDDAAWTKVAATVTANVIAAPDGTMTADKLVESVTAAEHRCFSSAVNVTAGAPYVFSFYAKAAERAVVAAAFTGPGVSNSVVGCYVNLTTQAVTNFGAAPTSTTVTDVGNGWYRIALLYTATATAAIYPQMYTIQTAGTISYTGDGTSGIYIWGASLTTAANASLPYQPIDTSWVASIPGNHATQSTSTSRPVLSARYNLLTKTEQFNDAAWTKTRISVSANAVIAPDGTVTADKLVEDTTASASHFTTSSAASFTAGTAYTLSAYAKAGERSQFGFNMQSTVAGVDAALFNLATGSVIQNGSFSSTSITPVGNGWYRCTGTITATGTASAGVIVRLALDGATSYTGDGTSGIFIWGASLVPTNQSSLPYQRVDTSTVYDSDATKFPAYLKFDGVDDWMVTPTITPGTDKVQVFAGVRQVSTLTATGQIVETSVDVGNNNGALGLAWPAASDSSTIRWQTRGTIFVGVNDTTATAPRTSVLSFISDIAADSLVGRRDGAQVASSTADQGTGNYLAYPLYIGRRGGTSLPFNGQLYSLITRFGPNLPTATIQAAEKYVAQKTGITI